MKRERYDVAVVGGGFFGASLAAYLAGRGASVVLLERGGELMQRASYVNQARVHNGYHYPRSILTALRSRVNFPRFVRDFEPCIVSSFEKYYAVPRNFSKVSARQFQLFMERVGAPIRAAPDRVRSLFNADLIEDVFLVTEYAFDAVILADLARRRMEETGVEVALSTRVVRLAAAAGDRIDVAWQADGREGVLNAGRVLNCTYSQINELLLASGLPPIPLKHELTEMALIEVPEELQSLGITVMCGPFFSAMPFPPRRLHTLSHVRYTPHCSWHDARGGYRNAYDYFAGAEKRTHFPHMVRDAMRYLPALGRARYEDSLWEVKTVLPQSEVDDSRPILFKKDHGLKNLFCIMGGKIDNIYDAIDEFVEATR